MKHVEVVQVVNRMLITGAAGFIGSHALRHFWENLGGGWEYVVVESLNYASALDRIAGFREKIKGSGIATPYFQFVLHDLRAPVNDYVAKQIGEIDVVVHFAAETHVDKSMVYPRAFIESNIIGTFNLLEFCREHQPRLKMFYYVSTDESYGSAPVGVDHAEDAPHRPSNPYSASKAAAEDLVWAWNHSMGVPAIITNCFSMDTKVMTANGRKSYSEVQNGELVWTLDERERLVLQPVLDKVKVPSNGVMIRIKTAKVDQLVTPNHRMMVRRASGRPRRWRPIEEIYAEQLVGNSDRLRIPLTGEWHGIPDSDLKLARILGWYVSEGWPIGKDGLAFGASSKKQQAELINLLIPYRDRGLGGRWKDRDNGKPHVIGRGVHVYRVSALRQHTDIFGKGALSKRVPSVYKQKDVTWLREFFYAALAGDGTQYKSALVYYTSSSGLADDMAEIGMKLGYGVRVSERRATTSNLLGRLIRAKKSYVVSFHLPYSETSDFARRVKYHGDVWCVSVPSGRVFVERHGAISLSGQTMNNIGETQHPEKYVPKIIRALINGEVITVHGSPDQPGTRKYLYARDHADAIVFLMQNGRRGEKYNVVGAEEINNLELVRKIEHIFAYECGMSVEPKIKFVDFHSTRPGHDLRYSLDGGKMARMGWTPPTSVDEALKRTIKWTLQNQSWL